MSDTPAARRWRPIIAEQERSGLSIRKFAESRGYKASTLAWWRSRLRQKPVKSTFVEVPVVSQFVPATPSIVLELDSFEARVLVDPDTDLALLKKLLVALC